MGPHSFDVTYRALVMGILNRTPDSFYDAGEYWDFDDFLRKAEKLVDDGADFLDVGGVKAGPGDEVDETEELERVIPALEALRSRFDIPLSVDTWRSAVLRQAIDTGANIGNDISGFADPEYLKVAAEGDATVVATHIRLAPRVPDPEPVYEDLVADVKSFLKDCVDRALAAGLSAQRIVVDAGLDLGKTPRMSWELLHASDELASLGLPLLLSASNKRFLFELLETSRYDVESGTYAAHALGIAKGCRVIRAHDVRAARRLCDIMSDILHVRDRRRPYPSIRG